MRLGTAIEKLVDNYKYAVDKEWIQDKVAWALYHTWKEADEHEAEQTEPSINCSTCGYSPQTPSCDSCEGYSNWWALDPCDECVFVKGSGWCDNCKGKPKGLDALPNSRKAKQTEPSTDCSWK